MSKTTVNAEKAAAEKAKTEISSHLFLPPLDTRSCLPRRIRGADNVVDWNYLVRLQRAQNVDRSRHWEMVLGLHYERESMLRYERESKLRYYTALKLLSEKDIITYDRQGFYVSADGVSVNLKQGKVPTPPYFVNLNDAKDYASVKFRGVYCDIHVIEIAQLVRV